MSDLTAFEGRKLEKLLGMGGGYVLNFSDRTYSEFFLDYRIDIEAAQYRTGGGSKAKRMRTFWAVAPNHTVGRVLEGLIAYGIEESCLSESSDELIDDCRVITQRLLADQPVAELDSLTANSDDHDFEVVAEHVREAIKKNQPEGALDRLHTFVIKFIRVACEPHGIEVNRDKALHSIFGEYVKALREGGHLESQMAERILKSSISVLESFNDVRNNKSLAHDNPILNYEESLLIFNHVAASIRFIKALELKIKAKAEAAKKASWEADEVPF
jgi:hypothetical protein